MRRPRRLLLALLPLVAAGCRQGESYPANYREYAYVSNSGSNSVTVLDVVNLRQDRVIPVGAGPSAMAASPDRNEVYVVNTGGNSVSVIDAEKNTVAATIAVGRRPVSIDVTAKGDRALVANAGSNNVSLIDLERRRVAGVIGAGEGPAMARMTSDGRTVVISNRNSGSVSIADTGTLRVRSSFDRCPGAGDVLLLPDASKAFVACSGGHQVLVIGLAHDGQPDVLLTFLDVGRTPMHIALKPDGGEAFVANYDSDTISELTTNANEVGGAYLMGTHPVRGLVSADNSLLYVSSSGAGRIALYGIDDGKLLAGVHVGEGPDALAFSASGRLLFVVNTQSGDIAVLRLEANAPSLLTLFPAGRAPNDIVVKAFSVR